MLFSYIPFLVFLENDENEDLDGHTSLNSNSDRANITTDSLLESHVYSCKAFVFHICIAYQRYTQITQLSSYTGLLNNLLIVYVFIEY